ncbi:protein NDUFAF4 homolog [Camponotus floridanus]|uniref:protein NDUFAF4 homolog n=1 Tax=Camponotus floridanus TaxID=104421 RepID=UPI000DC69251|nr:protein NDUFAF4 homolog [Camponotus floridanus]
MGKVYSMLIRPIRTFNIENRATRIISREKPIPAPQYPSTERQKKLSEEVNPNFIKEHYQKNMQLDQRLKDVFVTSTDPQEAIEPMREPRLLPQNRITPEYSLDFFEPTMIPAGKCSLKQILEFIMQHKHDPVTYNSENIAVEYKIDKKIVDDILKHFKLYTTAESSQTLIDDSFQEMFDDAMKEKKRRDLLEKEK